MATSYPSHSKCFECNKAYSKIKESYQKKNQRVRCHILTLVSKQRLEENKHKLEKLNLFNRLDQLQVGIDFICGQCQSKINGIIDIVDKKREKMQVLVIYIFLHKF